MPDLMDEIIRAAMERGDFDNLPGESKPLNLEDDAHTPAHLRLAHKVLRDNGLAPEWLAESKGIDHDRDKLLAQLGRARARLRSAEADQRTALRAGLAAQAAALNKRILTYNLKAPPGMPHKPLFDLDRELG